MGLLFCPDYGQRKKERKKENRVKRVVTNFGLQLFFLFVSSLLSRFIKTKKTSIGTWEHVQFHGNMGTYKIGEGQKGSCLPYDDI
jgi:hypothetical protein